MNQFSNEEQQRRDDLLLNLLKAPPQPRPKRDSSKEPTRPSDDTDIDEMSELSA